MPRRSRQALSLSRETVAMSETRSNTHPTAKRRHDRRIGASSTPRIFGGEMTYLVLISVAAAFLTGVLALPFTMPGRAFAEPLPAFATTDAGQPPSIGTTPRLA